MLSNQSSFEPRTMRARRRPNSGWLDAVYLLLLFEVVMMFGLLGLLALDAVRIFDLVDPKCPVVIQALQWLVWFCAPPALLAAFVMRVPSFPLLFLGFSLAEHLVLHLPSFVFDHVEVGLDWSMILVWMFITIDVLICFYLFMGAEPRRAFGARSQREADKAKLAEMA